MGRGFRRVTVGDGERSPAAACRKRRSSRHEVPECKPIGQALRTYRHAPNTGSRKSWAAGDATSRAVRLALIAKTGEMGYPSVLTAKTWGFYDVSFRCQPFRFQRPDGSYVMENVLFKISFPAEFHSQTAVEAAMTINAQLAESGKTAEDIAHVTIRTHEA